MQKHSYLTDHSKNPAKSPSCKYSFLGSVQSLNSPGLMNQCIPSQTVYGRRKFPESRKQGVCHNYRIVHSFKYALIGLLANYKPKTLRTKLRAVDFLNNTHSKLISHKGKSFYPFLDWGWKSIIWDDLPHYSLTCQKLLFSFDVT